MESIQVLESVLGLNHHVNSASYMPDRRESYVHHVVVDDESCASGGDIVAESYLTNAAVATKELIQVFAFDIVVEVFDEEDTVRACRKLCLAIMCQ